MMEARCSFLAAVCVPEELLFGTGAGAHRSPLCPPPASRPGLVDKKKKKKKYSWVISSNSFRNCYILSLVPPTWSYSWLEVLDSDCHLAPWWLFWPGTIVHSKG